MLRVCIMIKLRVRGMLIARVMLRDRAKVRELQDQAQGHG